MESKANIEEVNESLQSKANKTSVANPLQRKANRSDVDQALESKADITDLDKVCSIIETKVESADFEELARAMRDGASKVERAEF